MITAIFKEKSTNFFYNIMHPSCFLLFSALLYLHPTSILAVPPTLIALDYLFKQWLTYKQREFIDSTIKEVLALCTKVQQDHADLTATTEMLNKNIIAVDAKLRSIPGWNGQ